MSFVNTLLLTNAGYPVPGRTVIAYNDASMQFQGRFTNTGTGIWTGWGPPVVFKVKNTSTLIIKASVVDPNGSALTFAVSKIDNDPSTGIAAYFTTAAQIYTGDTFVTVPMINDGQWHTVSLISCGGYIADSFNEVAKATVTSYEIDFGGSITTWTQGPDVIQMVGDSWMGTQNDWPRLMDLSKWNLYYVSAGGMTCAMMDTQYNYDYAGHLNTTDPTAEAVVVSFGVNDFNSAITQAAFETSCYSLFDKIRVKQPTAKIFLIRCVSNTTTGKDFGKYGANMQNVVNNRTNCVYVDTTSLDATIEWGNGDEYHLSAKGKQTIANFVNSSLISNGI